MSRPLIIRPTQVAEAIANALRRYAEEVEAQLAAPVRKSASEVQLRELLTMFELHESLLLMRLITEQRRRCRACNAGRSFTRMSGENCLECAQKMRATKEAQL